MTATADLDAILAELHRRLDPAPRRSADAVALAERWGTEPHLTHLPKIVCADGFTMSVQASGGHYCSPRDSEGPWSTVEVGYPSERVEAFMPHIDGGQDDDPTATVYGYVPIRLVAQAILDHGGFAAPRPV